jgi:hypothetical protein
MFWMLYAFFWVTPWHLNFICQRFRTLSVPSSQAGKYEEWLDLRMLGYLYWKRFGSKIARVNRKEGDRVGVGLNREAGCGGQWPTWRPQAHMWRRWGVCWGDLYHPMADPDTSFSHMCPWPPCGLLPSTAYFSTCIITWSSSQMTK